MWSARWEKNANSKKADCWNTNNENTSYENTYHGNSSFKAQTTEICPKKTPTTEILKHQPSKGRLLGLPFLCPGCVFKTAIHPGSPANTDFPEFISFVSVIQSLGQQFPQLKWQDSNPWPLGLELNSWPPPEPSEESAFCFRHPRKTFRKVSSEMPRNRFFVQEKMIIKKNMQQRLKAILIVIRVFAT